MTWYDTITLKLLKWYNGHDGVTDAHHAKYTDAEAVTAVNTDDKYLKKDGSEQLTAHWDIGGSYRLLAYRLQQRDASGIRIDGAALGIFVNNSGQIGCGTLTPEAGVKLDVNGATQIKAPVGRYAMTLFSDTAGRGFLINTSDYLYNSQGSRLRMSMGSGTGDTYALFQSEWKGTTPRAFILNPDGGDVGIGTTTPTARLDVNSDKMRVRTAKTPASAGASGNQGDICWDSNYIYVCTATNTWKRSALSTW